MIPEVYSRVNSTFSPVAAHRCELYPQPTYLPRKQKKDLSNVQVAWTSAWRNLVKATQEHITRATRRDYTSFITVPQIRQMQPTLCHHLDFEGAMSTDIGVSKSTNQDEHFAVPCYVKGKAKGVLAGVIDGHSDDYIAKTISKLFKRYFAEELETTPENIFLAFRHTIAHVQEGLRKNFPSRGGAVAVFCFFEHASGCCYTDTLGDAEAFLIRVVDGKSVLIPLSPLRDWGCDSEMQRAGGNGPTLLTDGKGVNLDIAELKKRLQERKLTPRSIRVNGLNLSRGFGDFASFFEGRGVIASETRTVVPLRPNDFVLMACDGVTNYVKSREILTIARTYHEASGLVETILETAIENMKARNRRRGPGRNPHGDNVTAIAFKALKN